MSTCLITVLLGSIGVAIHDQNRNLPSSLELNLMSGNPQNPDFSVKQVGNKRRAHSLSPLANPINKWGIIRLTNNEEKDFQLSMALDSHGYPHILWHVPFSYLHPSTNIKYGRFVNETWKIKTLSLSPDARSWWLTDIAIDSNDYLHTVTSPGTIEGPLSVSYGRNFDRPRVFKQVIPEKAPTMSVRSIQIVVDTRNIPHIVALSVGSQFIGDQFVFGRIIEYGTIVGASWQVETVWDGASGGSPALAVDSNNRPHIAWFTDDGLYYATYSIDDWQILLLNNITISSSPSLVVDSTNLPHIAWEGDGQIYYMYRTAEIWENILVPTSSEQNQVPSLCLDTSDQPHLVWAGMGQDSYEIFYAIKEQDAWKHTQLTNNSVPEHNPSLLLDHKDLPHIVWVMGVDDNQEIMYASRKNNSRGTEIKSIAFLLVPIVFALVVGSFLLRRFKYRRMNRSE